MNILKELKRAWDNAVTTKEEKKASSPQSLEKLKEEIEKDSAAAVERPTLSDSPVYEKIEYTDVDDDELKARAENAFKDYANKSAAGIERESVAEREKLEGLRETAEESGLKREREIEAAYEKAKRALDNDALKRGLARSSIAIAKSAELEDGRKSDTLESQNAYNAEVQRIAEQLSGLEGKRQSALDALERELMDKVSAKADELREREEEKRLEALKYNNTVEEKSAKDRTDRLKLEQQLYAQALDNYEKEQKLNGSGTAAETRYASNYNKMDALLCEMNRKDAAKLIKDDPFFRANLSDYLYYKLYTKYSS